MQTISYASQRNNATSNTTAHISKSGVGDLNVLNNVITDSKNESLPADELCRNGFQSNLEHSEFAQAPG